VNEPREKPVILPEHREQFIHQVGKHLADVIRFGSIEFNFSDGKYVNANIKESVRPQ